MIFSSSDDAVVVIDETHDALITDKCFQMWSKTHIESIDIFDEKVMSE